MKIPFLLCAILLAGLSIPLFIGKWANLIAGYNTMRLEEKEKIDKLKLCRVLAMTLDVTSLVLILGAANIICSDETLIVSIAALVIGAVLCNIIPKRRNSG